MQTFKSKLRGAIPSARHHLAAAIPHQIIGVTPSQFLLKPARLSMWLNDQYGDCVTAESAFAKACMNPEIFIQDATVFAFAQQNNLLDGADIATVLTLMQTAGFAQDGKMFCEGAHNSVDWTNDAQLQNAIATSGPVKIGVAADQLQTAVEQYGDKNGWFGHGFHNDANYDHCVSLCGFGTAAWLASQLGVAVPSGLGMAPLCYALFTWDSIGIIGSPSMQAITGEAWVRSPVTVIR